MTAQLQWAMVDGAPMSVFALIDTKIDDRPKGSCPGCGRGTVWKIGEGKVTPHVAHEADAACGESGVTASETAEHINAKLHLRTLLAATRSILIGTRCREGHEHRRAWDVPAWDSVDVEYAIGSVRPDIVLTSATGEQVAVEVLHSHAVDGRKTRKLAALGIPWIEVRAEFALAWTGQGALRVHAADTTTHPPGCRRCGEIEARAEEERAARAERMEAQRAKAQQREQEAACARALAAAEEARVADIRQRLWEQRANARWAELRAAERERAEATTQATRPEASSVERHDYKASRGHWDAVFAEPWARDYMRSVRGER